MFFGLESHELWFILSPSSTQPVTNLQATDLKGLKGPHMASPSNYIKFCKRWRWEISSGFKLEQVLLWTWGLGLTWLALSCHAQRMLSDESWWAFWVSQWAERLEGKKALVVKRGRQNIPYTCKFLSGTFGGFQWGYPFRFGIPHFWKPPFIHGRWSIAAFHFWRRRFQWIGFDRQMGPCLAFLRWQETNSQSTNNIEVGYKGNTQCPGDACLFTVSRVFTFQIPVFFPCDVP